MGKKLLVTGGAGFIGAHFIEYILRNTNYEITNLDALTYAANPANVKEFEDSERYHFIKCDIGDKEKLNLSISHKYYAIINFAAESHVDRSIDDPYPFIHSNITGTLNLLEAVLAGKADKMVQISTDEVYGSLKPNEAPFTEKTSLAPNNPYAASKAAADMLVRSYFKTHQLNLNITRCSNNYGPMQHKEKLIPKVITKFLKHEKIPLYGDGQNIRDWLYVEDHCRAIRMVLESGKPGEVYNIGGSEEKTNIEVIEMILNKLGKEQAQVIKVPDRKGHDRRYSIDSTKILKDLGWKPEVTFEDGLIRTLDWYCSKANGRK
ncbi:dTDP-glucose 4,6-dehydratase [Cytobacillus firmus]|uniref:dTDP-glucose 4,6-dehydratase n=1 Tax=Bacillus sp. 22-7 TaxID=2709707 RepID=UPI0013D27EA6|nr:dTDP-glucose 4,6-dehydratase [Bacillus sp. 22-7]